MPVFTRMEGARVPSRLPQGQGMPAWEELRQVTLPILPFRARPQDSPPPVVQTLPEEPPSELLSLQFLHI